MEQPDQIFPIRRALLSVYDKTGLVPFAEQLREHGVELVSSGGTASVLEEAGLPVTRVTELTNYPEMLRGRVKTLHPAVHGGILAVRTSEDDLEELEALGITPIDLVGVNLYPFHRVVEDPDVSDEKAVELIDIGGPTLLRAAAKNFAFVASVYGPEVYETVLKEMAENEGGLTLSTRKRLAAGTFRLTAQYDAAIADHFGDAKDSPLPETFSVSLPKTLSLRYGENPHQQAGFYSAGGLPVEVLHGKPLSYNNLLDLDAALSLMAEFAEAPPTCAILKHTNPCGVAVAETLETAYERAFATDRQSPFGGIVIVNRPLDRATAERIDEIFTELIIAPDFENGVLDHLKQKKRRRLLRLRDGFGSGASLSTRSGLGGILVQEIDPVLEGPEAAGYEVVTERGPNGNERRDLDLAWRVVKHVKSNAIVYVKDGATVGIGAGQMSRVDSAEVAVMKAKKSELDLQGSVVASDAFYPFADGVEVAARNGARAIIQPGGSIRDEEVIQAANEHDVAMVFTGQRHFRH